MDNKPLVILTGPTAVGKTELSIALAKKINGEIISADSMQVYKYMDIGTAKITPDEMQGVPHYLIDEYFPDESFNVVAFKQKARHYTERIYSHGKIPIIVGGTGFYIQALLYDIDFAENDKDDSYRESLKRLVDEKGNDYLHQMLFKIDSVSASRIHYNNVKRVIRAIEYFHQTGQPISKHNDEQRQRSSPYHYQYFVLNDHRELLYEKINKRIDLMINMGLVDEVRWLLDHGYSKHLVSMQGLGYKEIVAFLEGSCSLDEALNILKRETRHFAKRQITWFKREREVTWIHKYKFDSMDAILDSLLKCLRQKGIILNT